AGEVATERDVGIRGHRSVRVLLDRGVHIAPLIVDGDGIRVGGGVTGGVGRVANIEIRTRRDAAAGRGLARGVEYGGGFAAHAQVVGAGDSAGDRLIFDDINVHLCGRIHGTGAFLVHQQAQL